MLADVALLLSHLLPAVTFKKVSNQHAKGGAKVCIWRIVRHCFPYCRHEIRAHSCRISHIARFQRRTPR